MPGRSNVKGDGVSRRAKRAIKSSKRRMENMLTFLAMARGEKKRNLDVEYEVAAIRQSMEAPKSDAAKRRRQRREQRQLKRMFEIHAS